MSGSADPLEPVEVPPVRRGRRLGRYVLCYELAAGGMATVYLARASGAAGFEKLVAIKIIHPHLAKEPDFVEMFLDEARIAARIDHPNVCSVFDFGEAEGTYFLAMEYLVGETASSLARSLAKSPDAIAPERATAIIAYVFQQICEGLHAAHELKGDRGQALNVVHRDVTPQNLFIGYDGSVRVVDFGVASAVGRLHHTTTGTLKGKYAYMSPEQVEQKPLDRRSDIWSLGVSLWEMLTRRRLFRRDGEYETLNAVMGSPIPKPSEVRPHISPVLDTIVMRALTRDRDARYATAREMGRDLGRFVSAEGGASSADLADLMDLLYADRRKERSALLDRARKMDVESPSTSEVRPAPKLAAGERSEASMPSRTIAEPPSRRGPLIALGLVAALLGAAGVAAVLFFDEPSGDAPSAGAVASTGETPGAGAEPGSEPPPGAEPEGEPVAPSGAELDVGDDPDSDESGSDDPDSDDPEPVDAPTDRAPETGESPATPSPRQRRGRRPAPSPAPAAEPAPTGRGTVNVVTPPGWAEILVDGRRVGRSPTEVTLSAGTHRLRLLPYGEGPAIERRVTVAPGETSRISVRLPD